MTLIQTLPLALAIVLGGCTAKPVGFSYTKFSGPVSGPEKEVYVQSGHHGQAHVDYIAKPDYHFSYGVEDPKTRVLQNRKESRNGDTVTGEYSVVDPDGTLRVVKYTADNINGFQAEIITNGQKEIHGHHAPAPVHHEYHVPSHEEREYNDESPSQNHGTSYNTHEDVKEDDGDDEEGEEDGDDDEEGY